MARLNLPYLVTVEAKGALYGYYRRDGRRTPIKARDGSALVYGSAEWMKRYADLHAMHEDAGADKPGHGSLNWLVEKYYAAPEFTELKPTTQKSYKRYIEELRAKYGNRPIATMERGFVMDLRDAWAHSPRRANYYIQMLSILCEQAINRNLRTDNPAKGVKKLKDKGGWRAWEPEELLWFEGTATNPAVRVAYFLALYTGQRKSDVLGMTWRDIQDGVIKVVQEKTGEAVWIPIHPTLQDFLDNEKKRGIYLVANRKGDRYTVDGFDSIWDGELRETGVTGGCTFHGMRKNATCALAEAGCTNEEIKSVTGHKTDAMVALYTRDARQKLLAQNAMRKLANRA